MPGEQLAPNSRLSSDSESSQREGGSVPSSSSDQSTSALIRVHGPQDEGSFEFSDEEDQNEDNSTPEVILSPSHVFGYILSPYMKLGAMLILSSQSPLKGSLPALFVFAFLAAFSRQIWFLLARYVGKTDIGDIVAEAVARGHGKEGLRTFVKSSARVVAGVERILLAAVYLKGAISCMEPLWPADVPPVPPSLTLSVIFMIFLSPISIAPTLASKRLVYSTAISNGLYIAWLLAMIYAHATGTLNTDNVMVAQGRILQNIPSIAFAFASVSNLHIYAGMAGLRGSSGRKEKRYLSISSISFTASLVGTGLVLPVLFPSVKSHGDKEPTEDSSLVQALVSTLGAFILLLAIPPLITTSPHVPIPSALRRITKRPLGRVGLLILLFGLSLLPRALEPILEDTVAFIVLLSTYFLPALLHIILHIIRRPKSIIVDPRPLLRSSSSDSASDDGETGPSGHDRDTEELLLRKEQALQRRRFGRRIMWDLGVWILLVPVSGGGMVWAVGRLANAW